MNLKALESKIGIPFAELGGLLAGGALYGVVNQLIYKIPGVKSIYDKALAVKYIGQILVPALPNLAAGIAASIIGRSKRIKLLEDVGHGMIGSAVVGMGVSAGQLFTAAKPVAGVMLMNGVDYTPRQMSGADFGGVDYTPMSGADFGLLPEGMGDGYEQENSDFGGVPEGLGEGQMG